MFFPYHTCRLVLQRLQGAVRAKELEMDSAVERAQQLIKGAMTNRSSQISELGMKYQAVSHKVKVSLPYASLFVGASVRGDDLSLMLHYLAVLGRT